MAEAFAAPETANDDAIASYFEVHVRRGERWVIDCASPSAAEALAEAEDIARRADVLAVKVVNERYNRQTDQSAARVIFSLAKPERKRSAGFARAIAPSPAAAPMPPAAATRPAEVAAPAEPGPRPPSAAPPPASRPAAWQLVAWASLALAVSAGLLFVLLLLVG